MKSKNIPADIRSKSIKEAQDEIKEILAKLEDDGTKLEDSVEQYERLVQLNYHVQELFKKRAIEINKSTLEKSGKIFSEDLK